MNSRSLDMRLRVLCRAAVIAAARVADQLEEVPAGARVVSRPFEIPGIKPNRTIHVRPDEDGAEHGVHPWVAPLERDP